MEQPKTTQCGPAGIKPHACTKEKKIIFCPIRPVFQKEKAGLLIEITLSSTFFPPLAFKLHYCPPNPEGTGRGGSFVESHFSTKCLTGPRGLLGIVVLSSPVKNAFSGRIPQQCNTSHDTAATPLHSQGTADPWTSVATRQPRGLLRIQTLSDLARVFQFSFTPF